MIWCPAVASAWGRWGRTETTVLETIMNMGDDTERLSKLLHQASFLSGSMRSGEALDWQTAAGWLVRACATAAGRDHGDDDEDPEDGTNNAEQDGGEAGDAEECAVRWLHIDAVPEGSVYD